MNKYLMTLFKFSLIAWMGHANATDVPLGPG